MQLDAIDLRILDELQRDGALSNVALARRVHLSPSPCLARVKALEAAGVIQRYVALAMSSMAAQVRATIGPDPLADGAAAAERNQHKSGTGSVRPRTAGQQRYLECMDNVDVVFAVGPAGTGKTFLAVAKAIA